MRIVLFNFFLIILFFSALMFSQEKEIREDVKVVNVEVPFRVIHKKKPVSGLKKSDFTLFLNGKETEINGFFEHKRKISVDETEFTISAKKRDPRLFVLVFNLTSFHLDVDKGVDYFFDNLIKENDRLMVLANNTYIPEKQVHNIAKEKQNIKKILKKESKLAKNRVLKVILNIESISLNLKYALRGRDRFAKSKLQLIQDYLIKYLEYYSHYKKNFLTPDLNKYYYFAKYLNNRKEKKWVISFFQLEKFPKMKSMSRLRREIDVYVGEGMANVAQVADIKVAAKEVQKLLWKIDKELNVANDFPVDQIKQLFLQVNTTFHTIFMRSVEMINSEDYELKRISTEIENSLREITKFTGGKLLLSNNLEKSLQKVSEEEDIFYVLSYSPDEKSGKDQRIKIKLKGKPYKIYYNKNVYRDYFKKFLRKKDRGKKDIKVENLDFKNSVLSFNISEFETIKNEKNISGKVKIVIRIIDSESNVIFNQQKGISIKNKKTKISIRFNKLKKGEYNIFVNVTDLINRTSSEDNKKIIID